MYIIANWFGEKETSTARIETRQPAVRGMFNSGSRLSRPKIYAARKISPGPGLISLIFREARRALLI